MAGIAGYIGDDIVSTNPELLDHMSKEIQYAGSDFTDRWRDDYFAVSRVHHGVTNTEKQPIFNEDRSMFIFMDGEVYDYEADKQLLLSKGHRFQFEQNDAEFCLHLYEELGQDSFIKLNGSFLIVIYNLRSKELLLVNDRFSSCPLFYYTTNKYLIFGTQLKTILQFNQIPRHIDPVAVMEFFTFQRVLGTRTYYNDIHVMSPASVLRFRNCTIKINQYWEMNYKECKRKSKEYYVDALADALTNAVRRRTSDNFRFGILLSGGLDSRTVLAASDCPMTSFTIADFKNREVETAKKISDAKNCKNIFIKRDQNHYANILDYAVDLGDGMYRYDHAHFIGIYDRIKEDCDILLHGCALGALFQGPYLPRWTFHIMGKEISVPVLESLSEKKLVPAIFNKLLYSVWDKNPGQLFSKVFCEDFESTINKSVQTIVDDSQYHAKDCHNRFDYFVFYFLFKHFTYLNELCIRPYIEERRVVLDIDLFDLYLEMPPDLRFNGRILKKALEKMDLKIAAIPNANTGVSPTIPEYREWGTQMGRKFINKFRRSSLTDSTNTQGSWPNRSELIRKNNELKRIIWDVIHDDRCIDPAIFNKSILVDMFEKHLNYQEDFTWFFYLIPTFGKWYKKFGPK